MSASSAKPLASGRLRWLLVVALMAAAVGCYALRRDLIKTFFPDGTPGPDPSLSQPVDALAPIPPAARVRVVLLDGLSESMTSRLPHLHRACRMGIDLRVDNGFPTVSLPVQHVLWTGLTQVQSGVMYRIGHLTSPPEHALPAAVAGSIAVAESHPEIVHSFGFSQVEPEGPTTEVDDPWRAEGFRAAALRAVQGPSPLVFVHVLRIDEAGHGAGGSSPKYAHAARTADDLLGEMLAAAGPLHDTRFVLLSDHGHREHGGHGGAEPEIRIVRACIVGGPPLPDVPTPSRWTTPIHLVDLHRVLAESLGVAGDPRSPGRPLGYALTHPDPDATLPRPSPLGWWFAGLVVLGALGGTAYAARRDGWAWPWWAGLGYATTLFVHGPITLSNPVVYPPLGAAMVAACAPAAGLLAIAAWRSSGPWRAIVGQLAVPLGFTLATLGLCGALTRGLGLHQRPPLVPVWTAHASFGLTLTLVGAIVVALVLLLEPVVARRRRPEPSGRSPGFIDDATSEQPK